jgi:hypothetical protein
MPPEEIAYIDKSSILELAHSSTRFFVVLSINLLGERSDGIGIGLSDSGLRQLSSSSP